MMGDWEVEFAIALVAFEGAIMDGGPNSANCNDSQFKFVTDEESSRDDLDFAPQISHLFRNLNFVLYSSRYLTLALDDIQ